MPAAGDDLYRKYGVPTPGEIVDRANRRATQLPNPSDYANVPMLPVAEAAPADAPPEDVSPFMRVARAAGTGLEEAGSLVGGLTGLVASGAEAVSGEAPRPQSLQELQQYGEQHPGHIAGGTAATFNYLTDKLRHLDIAEDPGTNLDYLKGSTGPINAIGRGLLTGIDVMVSSAPDMAAVLSAFPLYVAARVSDTAREHAKNRTGDPNASPTREDYAFGTLGIPSAMLDKFGAEVMFGKLSSGGGTAAAIEKFADAAVSTGQKYLSKVFGENSGVVLQRLRDMIIASPLEAITEMGQQAVDYFGQTYNTPQFSWDTLWQQVGEAGVLGGLGAAVGVGVLGGDSAHTKPAATPGVRPEFGDLGRDDEEGGVGAPPGGPPGGPPGDAPPWARAGAVTPPATPVPEMQGPPEAPPYGPPPLPSVPPDVAAAMTQAGMASGPPQREMFPGAQLQDPVRALGPHEGLGPAPPPAPTTGTVEDPRQQGLGLQPELFTPDQTGPDRLPINAMTGRPDAVPPVEETGTTTDPRQRSTFDPTFLASQARRNLAARGGQAASPQAPAAEVAPIPTSVAVAAPGLPNVEDYANIPVQPVGPAGPAPTEQAIPPEERVRRVREQAARAKRKRKPKKPPPSDEDGAGGVTPEGPVQGPPGPAPLQGPPEAGPVQGPPTEGPVQGPPTEGPVQGPPEDHPQEPPHKPGMVRVYHGGSVGEGETGRWVSTDRRYASDYRGHDLPLHYLDIREDDPRLEPAYPEQSVHHGFTFNFETTPEEAAKLKPISRENAPPKPKIKSQPRAAPEPKPAPKAKEKTPPKEAPKKEEPKPSPKSAREKVDEEIAAGRKRREDDRAKMFAESDAAAEKHRNTMRSIWGKSKDDISRMIMRHLEENWAIEDKHKPILRSSYDDMPLHEKQRKARDAELAASRARQDAESDALRKKRNEDFEEDLRRFRDAWEQKFRGGRSRTGDGESARARTQPPPPPGSSTPAEQKDGVWQTDKDGYVLSDTGQPIQFSTPKLAGLWVQKTGHPKSETQSFELANHPTVNGAVTVQERQVTREKRAATDQPKPRGPAVAGRDYEMPAPKAKATPPAEAPLQPAAPYISVDPVTFGAKLQAPQRRRAINELNKIARESNQPGAATKVKELRTRAAKAFMDGMGMPLHMMERRAGLEPGALEDQFRALEVLGRGKDTGKSVALKHAITHDSPVVQVAKDALKVVRGSLGWSHIWSPAPGDHIQIGAHTLHSPSSINADLHRIANSPNPALNSWMRSIARAIATINLPTQVVMVNDIPNAYGLYYPSSDHIEMPATLGAHIYDFVFLHEALHAATVNGVRVNGALNKDLIDLTNAIPQDLWKHLPATLRKAVADDPTELITYGLTDPRLREILDSTPSPVHGKTLWRRFLDAIAKFLGLKTEKEITALDDLIGLTEDAVKNEAYARMWDGLDDAQKAHPDVFKDLGIEAIAYAEGFKVMLGNPRESDLGFGFEPDATDPQAQIAARMGREAPPEVMEGVMAAVAKSGVPDVGDLRVEAALDYLWSNYDHGYLKDGTLVIAPHAVSPLWQAPKLKGPATLGPKPTGSAPLAMADMLSTDPERRRAASEGRLADIRSWLGVDSQHIKKTLTSRFMTVNQLVQWYGDLFKGKTIADNPVLRWMGQLDYRRRHEGQIRNDAQKIIQPHNDLTETEGNELGTLAMFSTMRGIDPSENKPDDPEPDELPKRKAEILKAQRDWEKARKAWDVLSPAAKQVFTKERDFFRKSFGARRQLLLQHIMAARGADPLVVASITPSTSLKDALEMLKKTRKYGDKRKPTRAENRLEHLITGLYQEKPVYFPLRRQGRYYTSVEHTETETYNSMEDYYNDTDRHDDPLLVKPTPVRDKETGKVEATFLYRDVAFHQTVAEGNAYLADLKASNPILKDENITKPVYRTSSHGGHGAPVQQMISRLQEAMGKDASRDAVDVVLTMLPELSTWKSRMQRKNIPGVKAEQFRASVAREMKLMARQEALLKYSGEMAKSLSDMRKMQREVSKSGDDKRASLMNIAIDQFERWQNHDRALPPPNIVQLANRWVGIFGFTKFLVSPSFVTTNLTQIWLNSAHDLAGVHGYGRTIKALRQATVAVQRKQLVGRAALRSGLGLKAVLRIVSSKIKPDEKLRNIEETLRANIEASSVPYKEDVKKLVDELIVLGRAAETQAQELLHTAREGGAGSRTLNDVLEIAREMAQAAEATNRVVSGVASYLLDRQKGVGHEQAVRNAVDHIDLTHLQYDPSYRSEAFRVLPRFLTQFKDYTFGSINLFATHIARIAQNKHPGDRARGAKALVGTLFAYSLMGGLMGTLWSEPIRVLVSIAFYLWDEATGESHNPEREFRSWLREFFTDMAGDPMGGEVAVGGLPRLIGVDVSSKIGFSNMLLGPLRGSTPLEQAGNFALQMLGPVVGTTLKDMFGAVHDPTAAKIMAAIPIIPKTIRDMWAAYNYAQDGWTDNTGDVIASPDEMSTWDVLTQAMGYTPADVARVRERQGDAMGIVKEEGDRRDALIKAWRNADPKDRPAIVKEMEAFNAGHPISPITGRTLQNAARAKAEREANIKRSGGIDLPTKQLRQVLPQLPPMPGAP